MSNLGANKLVDNPFTFPCSPGPAYTTEGAFLHKEVSRKHLSVGVGAWHSNESARDTGIIAARFKFLPS